MPMHWSATKSVKPIKPSSGKPVSDQSHRASETLGKLDQV